jgi:hypothetical protein
MNQTHSNYGLQNTTIVQLLRSALALGPEAGTPALRFLAWCALQEGTADEEYPFLALSIMLLATSLRHHEADGVWLWQLSDWVIGVEAVARSRTQFWRDTWDTRWLLGLGYDEHSPLKEMEAAWQAVAWAVLVEPPSPHPTIAAPALSAIAERLSEPHAPA